MAAHGGDENVPEITSEQTEKLLQFQDLTGIEDLNRCRQILSSHNWSIEAAVQDQLNEEEGAPMVYRPQPQVPRVHSAPSHNLIRLHAEPRNLPVTWTEWAWSWLTFPFRFFYSTIFDLFRFACSFVRPDSTRMVTDPLGDVVTFINNFNEKYGDVHPTFYHGSYSQALNDAKKELKFFLVYLHGDDHQDTDVFCRETLCNPQVIDFINSNTIFWACSSKTPEGFRVAQALRESTYPFLALIVLRESRMTVVARMEGCLGPTVLVDSLRKACQNNEVYLAGAREERTRREVDNMIRQDQDHAYKESLKHDQEKARLAKLQAEEKAAAAEQLRKAAEEEERKKEDIARRKCELSECIPEEPEVDHPDAIKILLKLPNGTRLERRFLRDQSLKYLYYFVFCNEEAPDDFQIVANFPRKVIPCVPDEDGTEPVTFDEFGLGRAEMLFVHDNTS